MQFFILFFFIYRKNLFSKKKENCQRLFSNAFLRLLKVTCSRRTWLLKFRERTCFIYFWFYCLIQVRLFKFKANKVYLLDKIAVLSNSPARILTSNAERRSDIPSSGANKDMYYDYDYGTPPRRHVSNNRNTLKNADCRVKTRTLPHETYCDLYYHTTGCEGDQALLRSCPNGLLHTGGGRSGLIGVCDYPHNVDCSEKEKHSKFLCLQQQSLKKW